MEPAKLILPHHNKSYSIEELLKDQFFKPGDYEFEAISFIKQWVNGQAEFELTTSGSTGIPKTIVITRDQMACSAKFTAAVLKLEKGCRALVCLNTKYIAGKMMLVRCLETGMDIVLVPPAANPFHYLTKTEKIDFTALVPLQLQHALTDAGSQHFLHSIKTIIVGGAPVSHQLENDLQLISASVYSTYGMTETVSHIALRRLNGEDRSIFFKAFDEINLSVDERHCLVINSVLSNHQLLFTNDVVELLDDKCFIWKGRFDNVINSGGIKIHPEQLEAKIEQVFKIHHLDLHFFVAGIADDLLGEKVCMVVETITEDRNLNEERLLSILKSSLEKHTVPKIIYFASSFLYTDTGKVRRKETLLSIIQNLPK